MDYEIIEYEGKEARKYPNGVIRGEHGHVLYFPPEIGRAMVQRKEWGKLSAGEALAKATDSETPEEGWSKIIAKTVRVALENDQRPGNDAVRLIGQATGYLQDARQLEVKGQVNHVPQFPPWYFEKMKQLAEEKVIDAEAESIEDDDDND